MDEDKKHIAAMLQDEPKNINETVKAAWKKLRPLGLPVLEANWRKIEPSRQLLELDQIETAEWSDAKFRYGGTRHKLSKKAHGLVRKVSMNCDTVVEQCYCEGKAHGLSRTISRAGVEVELFKHGKLVASFTFAQMFDQRFQELSRWDEENLIGGVNPESF